MDTFETAIDSGYMDRFDTAIYTGYMDRSGCMDRFWPGNWKELNRMNL